MATVRLLSDLEMEEPRGHAKQNKPDPEDK